MRRLLRIILWFFLLIIFIVSIAFSLVNNVTVPLSFGFLTLSPQPVSVWIIAAFCLGAISGLILGAGFFKDIRARLKVRQLHKEIAALQLELGKIHTTHQPTNRVADGRVSPGTEQFEKDQISRGSHAKGQ